MKIKIAIPLFAFLLLASCNNSEHSIQIIKTENGPISILDVRAVQDSSSLNISDIAKDFEIIRLETTKESLMQRPYFYIGKEAIICRSRQGKFIMFSRSGEFIRVIVENGKGPNEISNGFWGIDDRISSKGYLFEDAKMNYLLQFDIKNPDVLNQISYAIPGQYNAVQLIDGNSLLCVPVIGGKGKAVDNLLVWQDLDGNVLHSIKNLSTKPQRREYGVKVIHKVGQTIKYRPIHTDSLFEIRGTELIPNWYFNCNNPARESNYDIREGDVNIGIKSETPNFFILNRSEATKVVKSGNNTSSSWDGDYLFIDKQKNSCFSFTEINNDFFGTEISVSKINTQSNGICFLVFDAFDLILLRDELTNSKPDSEGLVRLNEICQNLKEDDNPVLLIGKIR